jgi:predicted phage-related endonuclease
MRFTVCLADQRSDEWRAARCGRLTGSRAGDMLATIKSGEAAARRDYRMQLVCERLTGTPQDDVFVNPAMQRGIDCEPLAFAAYESLTGQVVQRSGFLFSPSLWIGCSLDGHVDDFAGILECKCPKSATHLKYVKDNIVPKEHLPQITHNLYVTGAEWCDFVSWDDRFPVPLQIFRARVQREDVDLKDYEAKALAFLAEVERDYQAISTMTDLPTVLKEAVHAV